MESETPSVGLAGDGDEISVIYDVEHAFGIKFDYEDSPDWITAGDLFASLKSKLSASDLSDPQLWGRFATALSQETGVDPATIKPSSPLILAEHPWRKIHDFLAWFWVLGLALVTLIFVAAFLTG